MQIQTDLGYTLSASGTSGEAGQVVLVKQLSQILRPDAPIQCEKYGLEQTELAERARVSVVTIRRLEGAQGNLRVASRTLQEVRHTLEQAGAEFIPDGVRRRRTARADTPSLYDDLRAISLKSAARFRDQDMLTNADLYDENGLPE